MDIYWKDKPIELLHQVSEGLLRCGLLDCASATNAQHMSVSQESKEAFTYAPTLRRGDVWYPEGFHISYQTHSAAFQNYLLGNLCQMHYRDYKGCGRFGLVVSD